MQALRTLPQLSDFFERVRRSPQRVLMLDYDGTLAPFRIDAAEAFPYPGVEAVLDAVMRDTRTRVVIVSGREASTLAPLLRLESQPEIWGSHGREHIDRDGRYSLHEPEAAAREALALASNWAPELQEYGGRCETKPGAFAVHWRGLSAEQARRLRQSMSAKFADYGIDAYLEWRDFDGGVELRAPGYNKGDVVTTILDSTPDAAAAYLGDDLTDEDAFAAIKSRGIGVLVRPELRTTAADAWLRPPRELLEFLEQWHRSGTESEATP